MQIVKTAIEKYVLMVAVLDYYTPGYVSSNEEAIKNVKGKQDSILTLRLLMSYIYGAPILDVSRSHTTTQHSR